MSMTEETKEWIELIESRYDQPVTQEEWDRVDERFRAARMAFAIHYPFLGHFTMKLVLKVARQKNVPCMAVSNRGLLYINPDWGMKASARDFNTVLCHEILHLSMLTFERQGPRKALLYHSGTGHTVSAWNIATDYANNSIIKTLADTDRIKSYICSVEDVAIQGLYDSRFENMTAEEIYDKIVDDAPELKLNLYGDMIDEGVAGADSKSGVNLDGLTPEQFWKITLLEAAERQKNHGTLPVGIQQLVSEITDTRISWQDALSMWIGENGRKLETSYRRPARRSESAGAILPSVVSRGSVSDVTVLIDTSGSMSGTADEIASEVGSLCESMGLTVEVIFVDCAVHNIVKNVESFEDIKDEFKGGGGSDFTPAFEHLTESRYSGSVIAFTDGYITVPEAKPVDIKNVLWVLMRDCDVDPTGGQWGQVLRVDSQGKTVRS